MTYAELTHIPQVYSSKLNPTQKDSPPQVRLNFSCMAMVRVEVSYNAALCEPLINCLHCKISSSWEALRIYRLGSGFNLTKILRFLL